MSNRILPKSIPSLGVAAILASAIVMWSFSQARTDDSDSPAVKKSAVKTFGSKSANRSVSKPSVQKAGRTQAGRTQSISAASVTVEDEAKALEFAQAHHPELANLVVRLQKRMQSQYARAIYELHLDATRINRLQPRYPERYDAELRIWKIGSRARLLAARLSRAKNSKTRGEWETSLRKMLVELTEAKAVKLKLEEQRLTQRLESIRRSISLIQDDPNAAAEREMNRLKRSLQRHNSKLKSKTANPAKLKLKAKPKPALAKQQP